MELNNFFHIVTIPTPETNLQTLQYWLSLCHTSGRGLWQSRVDTLRNNMEKHLGKYASCSLGSSDDLAGQRYCRKERDQNAAT